MERIQFNTGRKYSREGQRIVAILHDDNVVTFMDHDRMIAGEFTIHSRNAFSQREVMFWYDQPQGYRMSVRAMSPDHAWM